MRPILHYSYQLDGISHISSDTSQYHAVVALSPSVQKPTEAESEKLIQAAKDSRHATV
jgi:hypothetical protein